MKISSVLFTAPGQVEFGQIEADYESLGDTEVLVRALYTLVSAGTELACLSGREYWFKMPATPGYASVGEVTAVGEGVKDFAPGDLVYSMGGHQQYTRIDTGDERGLCVKLPAGIAPQQAVFTRMVCVAFTALRVSTIELGDRVGVLGLGLVGNFAAQLAGLQGAQVIALDLSERRVKLAAACGVAQPMVINADTVAEDVAALTGGQGVSTLIEATGIPRALPPALPIVGQFGEVILLGTPRGEYQADLTDVLSYVHLNGRGSLTFKGAHEWRFPIKRDGFVKHSIQRNAEIALALIQSGALQVAPLHTHTLPPAEAAQAYAGLKQQPDDFIGVVFDWTD